MSDSLSPTFHTIELINLSPNQSLPCFQALTSSWNHDADPSTVLRVNDQVEEFKKRLKFNPCYLQQKLEQYLKVCVCGLAFIAIISTKFDQNVKKKYLSGDDISGELFWNNQNVSFEKC